MLPTQLLKQILGQQIPKTYPQILFSSLYRNYNKIKNNLSKKLYYEKMHFWKQRYRLKLYKS